MCGSTRTIPDPNSPFRMMFTAADLLKLAMINVHRALKEGNIKTKMLLTVHDEIVFDLHRSEQSTALPLLVEPSLGPNWFDTHS